MDPTRVIRLTGWLENLQYFNSYFLVNLVMKNLLAREPNKAPRGTIPLIIPEASPGLNGIS